MTEIKVMWFVPCPKMDKHLVSYSDCLHCENNTGADILTGCIHCNYLTSAKPEQPSHSCTPCLANTHTPDSRHSGANDGEVLEDRICPQWRTCTLHGCLGYRPHIENHECGLGHGGMWMCFKEGTACIKIPEMWLDKGLPEKANQIMECDPEGMKPKSKYEKAEAVRKYVFGENYRDVK